LVVCRITSQLYKIRFDFLVENWQNLGLKLPSVIRIHKIATLEINLVDKIIGKLNEADKIKIELKFVQLPD
jgi:mRNA interferase MazF